MTQEALSEKIGIANSLVGKWEAGIRRPSLMLFLCWIEALHMTLKVQGYEITKPNWQNEQSQGRQSRTRNRHTASKRRDPGKKDGATSNKQGK